MPIDDYAGLLLLQAKRRMTGRELAERLEVSMRTVHRDMEALSAAGVPVLALRGAQGGWQLAGDWRAPVPGLDEAEVTGAADGAAPGDRRRAPGGGGGKRTGQTDGGPASGDAQPGGSIRQRLYVDTSGWRGATTTWRCCRWCIISLRQPLNGNNY